MTPACPCCGIRIPIASIIPDGTYEIHGKMLVSFKCIPPCLTNRAIKFEMVPQELRRAAMLADLALNGKDNEMEG